MRASDLPEVFSRAQALELGLSDERLSGMVRRGEINRLWCGVYATSRTDPVLPAERAARHVLAARVALSHHRAGFVVSHLTAAALHGLPLPLGPTGLVHVTAVDATQRSRRSPGVIVHHADSGPTEVTVVDELPVTGVARSVADCLRCYGPRTSVPIADAALHLGLTTPGDIEDQLDRQRRWRGRPRAMQQLRLIDGRRESWLESFAFVLFDEWGLELPEPQVWVEDANGLVVGRVDGAWLEDATVLELDGKTKYGTVAANQVPRPWLAEKVRYDRMGNLGLERIRLGVDDLCRGREGVLRTVRARRDVGSVDRFSGTFRLTDPTGLRSFRVSRPAR